MAAGLAAAIEKEFGIMPNLEKGHNGIFEVYASKRIIYSNWNECGRLPKNEEIIVKLRNHQALFSVSPAHEQQAEQDKSLDGIVKSGCSRGFTPKAARDSGESSCCD